MVATHALQVLPGGHQFLVGADAGRVLRGSWVGVPPAPKQYLPADHATLSSTATHGSPSREKGRYASSVTALHVSPFCPQAFLSGHDTGMVTLHYLDSHEAAVVWPEAASGAVAVVRWSASRPAVFLVLDKLCTLYTWDLTRSRNAPIIVQQVRYPVCVLIASASRSGIIYTYVSDASICMLPRWLARTTDCIVLMHCRYVCALVLHACEPSIASRCLHTCLYA